MNIITTDSSSPTLPEVATVEQVARHLQIDEKTVRKLLARGKLRGAIVGRHWRIPRAAVAALLGDTPPAPPFALPERVLRLGRAGRPRRRHRALISPAAAHLPTSSVLPA
jgi:excisionase family DNA binding protein